MHLWDKPKGFYGSTPIVAGTISLAVGAGLAAAMQKTGDVAVAYFGDGAVEEGVVHECLNLAQILKIPVLFVVENNLFSSHMHISLRQPKDATVRFADAHDMAAELIDGNDVVEVSRAAGRLIERARAGEGPGFLEAVTQRWYGHVDWREDIDVGVNRSTADLDQWRRRDPVARLEAALLGAGHMTKSEGEEIRRSLREEIESAWATAATDPYPAPEALLARVYVEK